MPDALWIALVLSCGWLVGFMLALTGGGGSILAVPLLIYVLGIPNTHIAIGTSALAVAINAYINLLPHARAGNVKWRMAIVFTILGILGAFSGSELGKLVDGKSLMGYFAMLMLLVSLLMLKPKRGPVQHQAQEPPKHLLSRLSGAGFGTGLLAGFFGVGGGFLVVPALLLAARIETITAIGTSLFAVGSFGLTTAVNYARSGLVDWAIAGQFLLGGVIGGWLGVLVAKRLAARQGLLKRIFAIMVLLIALYMLYKAYV